MFEVFSGVVIGLGSPAGLIISTLAGLTVILLAVQAVRAAMCERSKSAAPRAAASPAPARQVEERKADIRRAA